MTIPGHEGAGWVVYVERMEPERIFSFRWYDTEDGSKPRGDDQPGLLVEFRLQEVPNGTRLTITESGFSKLDNARRNLLMQRCKVGWNFQTESLSRYLSK